MKNTDWKFLMFLYYYVFTAAHPWYYGDRE